MNVALRLQPTIFKMTVGRLFDRSLNLTDMTSKDVQDQSAELRDAVVFPFLFHSD